jgi:hypothetical protein
MIFKAATRRFPNATQQQQQQQQQLCNNGHHCMGNPVTGKHDVVG